MPILIVLTVIIQGCFIYHVFRSGRPYWWAFIILSFPVMGCVIYYFVEMFPGSREHYSAQKKIGQIVKAVNPDATLKRRAEEVQICGSVENKMSLAEECINAGMFDDAIKLYESCRTGPYANDPELSYGLARAYFHNEQFALTKNVLSQLAAATPAYKPGDVQLLLARTLEGMGDTAATLAAYEKLIPGFAGFEAKCRYATLLQALGQTKQGNSVFEEVLLHAKRFNVALDSERQWVAYAKRNITNS